MVAEINQHKYPIQDRWFVKQFLMMFSGALILLLTPLAIIYLVFGPKLIDPSGLGAILLMITMGFIIIPILFLIAFSNRKKFLFQTNKDDLSISPNLDLIKWAPRKIPYSEITEVAIFQDIFDKLFNTATLLIGHPALLLAKPFFISIALPGLFVTPNCTPIIGLSRQDAEIIKEAIENEVKKHPRNNEQYYKQYDYKVGLFVKVILVFVILFIAYFIISALMR